MQISGPPPDKKMVVAQQLPSYKQYKKNIHENDKQMVLFI
jgi:hypothetical protein